MKVILLQDVENLGKKYDVKDVTSGFGRNYLIPKGLAELATQGKLNSLEQRKAVLAKKTEAELKDVQEIIKKLEGEEVKIKVKVGEEGQLYESVKAKNISDALTQLGFDISKKQIILDSPIKETGEFNIRISFNHNLEAAIKLIIEKE